MTDPRQTRKHAEQEEDSRPLLIKLVPVTGQSHRWLYLGNGPAAQDAYLLHQHNITSALNMAVNLQLGNLALPDGTWLRRTQIGLIDGAGNTVNHLLAGVLALDGLLGQASPGKRSYPPHRAANVLVHCRGGRSRSVAVLALYLYFTQQDKFPTPETALTFLRTLRGLDNAHPCEPLLALIHQVAELPVKFMFGQIAQPETGAMP
ncbi:dual specificity protein phosphatase [Rahnella sp. ChDrAdgB13]|uniref:dual specificity protein phosphatase family protein n=1 Tax=Rahnella sp. ChDrAdgB13 TaxID=1850581 RepID=UPI001FCB625E|nr:dual specificity protein phosphatase [Rahnella sp. ChDrAdgB13]